MIKFNPELPHSLLTFSGGEEHVQLNLTNKVEKHYEVRADLENSSDIFRFFSILDALNHEAQERKIFISLNVIMAYLPYARQDRYCAPGQSFSLRTFVKFYSTIIESCENLSIITEVWDAHSDQSQGLFSQHKIKANFIHQKEFALELVRSPLTNPVDVLVAPDKGATQKTRVLSYDLVNAGEMEECTESVLILDKVRDPKTGWITEMKFLPEGNLDMIEGRNVLVPDDICDGGLTFILAAKAIRKYNPKSLNLYISHGIFSKGLEELLEYYDQIWVANNIGKVATNKRVIAL